MLWKFQFSCCQKSVLTRKPFIPLGKPNGVKEGTYLRVIYKAFLKGMDVVGPSYVAKELGISKVTAYEALLKLAEMNYGVYIQKRGFMLNSAGIKAGKNLTRRHRLIECLLAELEMDPDRICLLYTSPSPRD